MHKVIAVAAGTAASGYVSMAEQKPKPVAGYTTTPIKCEDGTMIFPWACPSRDEQISRLKTKKFDVLVIGGGCVGAGVALDAATRGLKCAMVEADDFAAGTSGRSTKLIHGGIRYLETAFKKLDIGMYRLVEEALAERAHMLNAAPFMARPLPIMIPIYRWWEVPYMWVGAKMYDFIAGSRRAVPASYYIDKEEALYQFPMLKSDGLKGAIVYYDGQHNDTRMNVLIALTAAQWGATTTNYVAVTKLLKDEQGKTIGARVHDRMTGEEWDVHAKAIINATGPFADAIRKMDDPEAEECIVPAAGVHITLPDHFSPDRMGLIVPKTKDGRVLFFLPWEGSTICGTTDSESPITMLPKPTAQEVRFILDESNRYLNRRLTEDDVRSSWSGLRPLVRDLSKKGADTSQISREHVVEVGKGGLVSIMGGKWTTYRRMAEDAVDKAVATSTDLAEAGPSKTLNLQLLGADRAKIVVNQSFDRIVVTLRESYELDKDVAKHLVHNYGTRALQVAEIMRRNPMLRNRVVAKYPFVMAEVVFAIEQEYACHALDVLARRTRLAFLDTDATRVVVPRVLDMMQKQLKWTKQRRQEEEEAVEAFLQTMHQ